MVLAAKFAKCFIVDYDASFKWLDQSVEIICTYLRNAVNDFRDAVDEKKLKLSTFFAKVLLKLFNDLSTQLHRASFHRHFIEFLRTFFEIRFGFVYL